MANGYLRAIPHAQLFRSLEDPAPQTELLIHYADVQFLSFTYGTSFILEQSSLE